jgi:hypothetical protein
VAATIIMSAATYFMLMQGTNVLINIAISIIIYAAVLYVLKEKLLKEIKLIFNF